jgi:hypothetical protein
MSNSVELRHFGDVKDGKLNIHSKTLFKKDVQQYEGKEVEIIIKKRKKSRSLVQNGFYWGVLIPIIKHELVELGWKQARSTTWVSNLLKNHCLRIEEANEDTGETWETIGETHLLSTVEWEEYIERIRDFVMKHLNIELPYPEKDKNKQQKIKL